MPEYEDGQFGSISSSLLEAVFTALPDLRASAVISSGRVFGHGDESDGLSVHVNIASPSGDPNRVIILFLSSGDPSLSYGPCHIHCSPDDEGMADIVNLIRKIISNQIVIAEEMDTKYDHFGSWFDMEEVDGIAEELTSPYSSGRYRLKSWSGAQDRDFGLSDLQL